MLFRRAPPGCRERRRCDSAECPRRWRPARRSRSRSSEFATSVRRLRSTRRRPRRPPARRSAAAARPSRRAPTAPRSWRFSSPGLRPCGVEARARAHARRSRASRPAPTATAARSCRPAPCSGLEARRQTAPVASFSRLTYGKVFRRKRAPRKLAGSVTPDPSGLLSVRLSILRRLGGRCWTFDGASERFERHRCGGRSSFRIGDRADWSYLLPEAAAQGPLHDPRGRDRQGRQRLRDEVVIRVR